MNDTTTLDPVVTTVSKIPTADDLPTVTVKASFDWKFWLGIGAAGVALYILFASGQHAARGGRSTRRRHWS